MKTTLTLSNTPMLRCVLHETHQVCIYNMKSVTTKRSTLRCTYRRNCGSTTEMKLTPHNTTNLYKNCFQLEWTEWAVQCQVTVLWLVRAAALEVMWLATLLTPVVIGRKYLPLHPVSGYHRSRLDVTFLLPTLSIPVSGGWFRWSVLEGTGIAEAVMSEASQVVFLLGAATPRYNT